jgi:hypothetical protein
MEDNKPEAPVKPGTNSEANILNFTLQFNEHNFNFVLCEIEKKKLKLIAKESEKNNLENEYYKYEHILELSTLKSSHKYFKMFDDYSEFKENFIALCNSKKVGITSFEKDTIKLKIDLALVENNIFTLELKKVEIKGKEKELNNIKIIKNLNLRIEELEKNSKLKDEKISSLEKEMEQNLKLKDERILSLERKMNELKKNKEKEIEEIKDEIMQLRNSIHLIKEECYLDIFKDSNILINNYDKKLNSIWVPWKLTKTELLFNSNTNGDSLAEFLKKSNGKCPTMVIIQTTKGGIFGGYTSKPWEQKKTTDDDAFVFSLYTKKKYSIKSPQKAFGLSNVGKDFGVLVFGYIENAIVICDSCTSNPQNYVGCGTYDIFRESELNNGEKYFTVKSFELFHLIN